MPAKTKLLPEPCPVCGVKNGTIQVGIIDGLVRFRIGHYNPEKYQRAKTSFNTRNIGLSADEKEKKSLRSSGREWHNFLIRYLRFEYDLVCCGIIDKNQLNGKSSITLTTNLVFQQLIKKRGWHALPSITENIGKTKKDEIKFNIVRNELDNANEFKEEIIDRCTQTRLLYKKIEKKWPEILPVLTDEEIKHVLQLSEEIKEYLKDDNPKHLLVNLYLISSELPLFLAKIYMQRVKKPFTISRKHVNRIMRGHIRNIPSILEPHSRDIAIWDNFTGLQCPDCKSWRVSNVTDEYATNGKYCHKCNKRFTARIFSHCLYCQEPLYTENIQTMKNNGLKCPHCGQVYEQEILELAEGKIF